jgi:hemoglobin-like flavoprotein
MERNELRLVVTHLAELARSPGLIVVAEQAITRLLADHPELAGQSHKVGHARAREFATVLANAAKCLGSDQQLRNVLEPVVRGAQRKGAGHEHSLECAVALLEAVRTASGKEWSPTIAAAWCEALETCLSVTGFPRQGALRSMRSAAPAQSLAA